MPPRGGHGAPAGRGWPSYLVSGLFCCLLLGLVLSPTPFLSSSSGGSGGSNGGHGALGSGGMEDEELSLLLRGKQTQRAAGVSHPHAGGGGHGGVELVAGGQPASTEGLLRYFAEARREGLLSAAALKEVELLLHSSASSSSSSSLPPLISPDAPLQEEIYWRGRQRREEALGLIHHNLSAIRPFDEWGPIYIWDWFSPDYVCSSLERVGRVGDGGKWMCGLEALRRRPQQQQGGRPCVVYAFGINDDTSFEEELVGRTGCQVFAFDPTVAGLPESARSVTPPLRFYKQALAGRDGPTRTFLQARSLYSAMRELGHDFIDVLKVDVEGAEWDAFAPLFEAGAPLPVGQLLIELHYRDVNSTFRFFQEMEKGGFRVFSRETNYQPCVTGRMPGAIEYSFLHPQAYFSGQPTPQSRHALAALPPHRRENGVIYLLTRRERVHSHLIPMLQGLDAHFNDAPGRRYPVIIFHDDFTPEDEVAVRAATVSPLTLRRVAFEVPAFLDGGRIPERTECSKHSSTVGYRHMCRFLGLQVQDLLDEYEWHWRLDDDSVFLGPIGYDPFRLMRENGKRYGFNRVIHDNADCVVGLWDAAKAFATEHGVDPAFLDDWDDGVVFYNNFEISHRSVWRDPTVRAFLQHIDRLGGIYYVRWGDAPIRSLAVALTVPQTQLHFFRDIGYAHQIFHRHPPGPLPKPFTGALWHLDGAFQYIRDLAEEKQLAQAGGLARRRQRGAIVIFSDATRFGQLKRCLASLEKHFNGRKGYPIWIWTHGLTYAQRLELRALSTAPVRIENLERPLLLPATDDDVAAAARAGPCLPPGISRRDANATRLLGWEVAQRVAARHAYQWRLADDAVFTADLVEDPFLTMVQSKATYGVAAVRPTPPASRPCIRELVRALAARLRLGNEEEGHMREEAVAQVLDAVEGAYFDPGFEVSHRSFWQDERLMGLIDVAEAGGWVGRVDEALLRSLAVALMGVAGRGAVHIFGSLEAVDLSEALAPWQLAGAAPAAAVDRARPLAARLGSACAVAGVTRDSEVLGSLFRPQRLGFLDAELGAAVTLPRGHEQHGEDAQAAERGAVPDLLWMLGRTRIGHMSNTRPVPAFALEDAAALLATHAGEADFSWRFQGKRDRMPVPILNDGTLGPDEALFPAAGLAVVVPGADTKPQQPQQQHRHGPTGGGGGRPTSERELRLVLLCERRNVSALVEPGQWTQLGSALVVMSNAQEPPSRWVYDVRTIPGTGPWSAWHTAMALTTGAAVAADPERDHVYIVGEQTTNVTIEGNGGWRLNRQQALARVPLASLLRLSFEGMELLARPDAEEEEEEEAAEEGQGRPRWLPYAGAGGLLEAGNQEGAERVKATAQPIIPGPHAEAFHAERVGLGYLAGPGLWYMADLAPVTVEEEGAGQKQQQQQTAMRLVLKTAAAPMGPWADHAVLTLPPEFATAQYRCPAVYPLPALERGAGDKDGSKQGWEAAVGLACLVQGHGARPATEGKGELLSQAGPTVVDLVRVKLAPLAEVAVESAGQQEALLLSRAATTQEPPR